MNAIRVMVMGFVAMVFVGAACSGAHTVKPPAWALRAEHVRDGSPSEEVRAILSAPSTPSETRPRSAPGAEDVSSRVCSMSSRLAAGSDMVVATLSDAGFEVVLEDGTTSTVPMGSMPAFWRAL